MRQRALTDRKSPLLFLGFVLLCTAPIVLRSGWIAHWPAALYNDLLLSHLPLSQIAHDLLFKWHQAPLWNPYLLSGMPLAADPLAGISYPPNWLAIIWPSAQVVNLLLIGHLVWASIGAWLLARSEGASGLAAIASGLIFGGASKLVTHLSLGHLGLVSAISWTPWVLLGIRNALEASNEDHARSVGLAGMSLGLLTLADPRWLIPAGFLSVTYTFTIRSQLTARLPSRELLKRGLWFSLFALGISACSSLPLWELVTRSTRPGLNLVEQTVFSLRAIDLLGSIALMPGEPERFIYIGSATLFLSLMAFLKPSRMTWFWGGTAVVATLLALGSATPLYTLFNLVPGANLLRVPGRFFILSFLALALLAGKGMPTLGVREDEKLFRRSRSLAVGCFLFVIVVNGAVLRMRGLQTVLGLLPVFIALAALVLLFSGEKWDKKGSAVFSAWLILIVLEAASVDSSLLDMRPIENAGSIRLADLVAADGGEQRIFSPTFSMVPLVSARRGLETVDGISPLQLANYHAYMSSTLGFDPSLYSVPLPPVGDEIDPGRFDLERLGYLNVKWILSDEALERSALIAEISLGGVHLYRLAETAPRAAFVADGLAAPAGQSAQITSWSPNRILIQTSGSGRLVLREVDYPGWIARIDNQPVPIRVEDGLFRAIDVPAGNHEVEFVFRPMTVYLGWGLTLLTLAAFWVSVRHS